MTARHVIAPALLAGASLFGCRQILGIEDPVPCTSDDACDPGTAQPCLEGQCVQGECVYTARPDGPTVGCSACQDGEVVPFELEGEACYSGPEGTEGEGVCRAGVWACDDGGVPACEGEVLPSEEICTGSGVGSDEDCDGQTDTGVEGCECAPGESIACYDGPPGTADVGECASGTSTCEATADGTAYGPCAGSVVPAPFDSCITPEVDEDCDGQTPACTCDHQFSVSFGGSAGEEAVSLDLDADGSLVLLAESYSPSFMVGGETITTDGSLDVLLVRFDAAGNPIKAASYGGTGFDAAADVVVVPDGIWIGGFLGNGSIENFGGGATFTGVGQDGFLVKLDADFNPIFKRKIGAAGNERVTALARTPGGGVAVTGLFEGSVDFGGPQNLVSSGGTTDMFVAVYASDGSHVWSRALTGSGTETAGDIAVGPNGDVVFIGYSSAPVDFGGGPTTNTDYDPLIARWDAGGELIFSRALTSAGFDTGSGVTVLSDGSMWIAGGFSGGMDLDGAAGAEITSQGTGPDLFVAKFDATGSFLTASTYDAEGGIAPSVLGMSSGADDAVFVSIHTSAPVTLDQAYNPANTTAYVLKLAPDGTLVCVKPAIGPGTTTAGRVVADDQGNFFAMGAFFGNLNLGGGPLPNNGQADMYLVKYRQ